MSNSEKICSKCNAPKPIDDFSLSHRSKDGHFSWCRECNKAATRLWRIANPKIVCESNRLSKIKNKERRLKTKRLWMQANPDKVREMNRKANEKRRNTPHGKLSHNISGAVRESLCGNKKGRHWECLVGYSLDQLKRHLEKKFKDGMTWERFIDGEIHIDHKIPITAFNFEKPEDLDFKKCWELDNLQPLWAKDNLVKNGRIETPFQPSLLLANSP